MKTMINLKILQNPKVYRIAWCFLAVWILWQCAGAIRRSASLPKGAQQALKEYKESAEKNTQAQAPKNNDQQKLTGMFVKQKKSPMPTCTAVLGNEALFNNKWHKVGSSVNGAKILEINPESVKILWEEKEQILTPFGVKIQKPAQPQNGQPPSEEKKSPDSPNPNAEKEQQIQERDQNAAPEEQEAMRRQKK